MLRPTRETAFDVLRGACVISMVISHIGGRYLEEVTHLSKWIDGSMGFVLISGLVLGMVQHRITDRSGPVPARIKVWRRAALIYAAHVGLTLVGLLVYELVRRPSGHPAIEDRGGGVEVVSRVFTQQVQLQWLNILSLYAVVLALVPVATWLLRLGRPLVLATLSAAVYVISYLRPDATMPSILEDSNAELNWGAWQGLFFAGFLVGWYWQQRQLSTQIQRPRVLVTAAAITLGVFVYSRVAIAGGYADAPPRLFAKWDLGPGTIIWSCSVFILGYWLVQHLDRWRATAAATWTLGMIGRRSLDAFMILGLAAIVFPALLGTEPVGRIGDRQTVVVLLFVAAWAAFRERKTLTDVIAGRRPRAVLGPASGPPAAKIAADDPMTTKRSSK